MPKLMKPEIIIAVVYVSVCESKEILHSDQVQSLKLLSRSEEGSKRRLVIVPTPITNTGRLLPPRVKHGTDDHKTHSDRTFTNSEDETTSKETSKVLASRMAA